MPKKILYIHVERKHRYGVHYINELIIQKLRKKGFSVDTIYPSESISLFSKSLAGIKNILFFHSLILRKRHASKYDLIQGTTYTTLPFLGSGVPVVSHFGSTTYGFLKRVPSASRMSIENPKLLQIFSELKMFLLINGRSSSVKALSDISNIEIQVAKQSDAVIAASLGVKKELLANRVPSEKIFVVHNAIEDYWFRPRKHINALGKPKLVYIGRMGDDVFTIKLKGINRLFCILKKFPKDKKIILGMCRNTRGYQEFFSRLRNLELHLSVEKRKIPSLLENSFGDIYVNTGRYEGFCLSIVEAMSQGLIPVVFPIGVAPEIIRNGKNGFVVHTMNEMVRKINALKKMGAEERAGMAVEAVKTSKDFRAEKMVSEMVKVYRELCAKRRRKARLKKSAKSGYGESGNRTRT